MDHRINLLNNYLVKSEKGLGLKTQNSPPLQPSIRINQNVEALNNFRIVIGIMWDNRNKTIITTKDRINLMDYHE